MSTAVEVRAYNADGAPRANAVKLPADPFDGIVHESAMHQAVKVYLANQRQGTVKTKTYPLQVVQGQLFGMSQSSANEWIQGLLPVLGTALEALGVWPEREGANVAQRTRRPDGVPDLIVDGVARPRQRPHDRQLQALHYSGKNHRHCDKNIVVVTTRTKQVRFLSATLPGCVHDKALADYAAIRFPRSSILRSDLGFQGYAPQVHDHRQPKKSRSPKT